MFERLGSATFRFRFLILLAWIAAAVFMATTAPSLAGSGSTDQTTFLPANAPSRTAKDALERAFPGSTSTSSATITMDRPSGLTVEDRAWRDAFAVWVLSDEVPEELGAAVSEVETIDSRPELEELFLAEDGTFELFVINLNVADAGDAARIVTEQLREHVAATAPAGLEAHVTGAAPISSDYLEAVEAGTDSTTIVTVILVVLVLLAIYRAPLAALIPLVTIGAAYVVSTGILGFLAAAGWSVSSTLATFLVVMVFGVGTDYAIFLISRYREEVSHDGDWHEAATIMVKRIGAVITASAGTVIVGMLAMGLGDFKMIASMGPGIAIAIAVTLVAALTLSPAMLSIFGHYLFWPLHTREKHVGEPRGFFAGLAAAVSRRPVLWTAALLVILIVPALYLPQVKSNFDVIADLPASADSRIGYEQIGEHLGEDKLVQSTGLVDLGGDGDVLAPAQLARLHALMVDLHEDGGLATTTSLITPDGDTTVPDGFRPSATLAEIADGFSGDDGGAQETDSASLLDGEVEDGLNQALDYVNGLAVAFPDVAAGQAMRDAEAGLEHALDIVDRVQTNAVLTTQLRTLSTSITNPANAATSSGEDTDDDSTLMSDYLAELAVAYPEVKSLDAWKDGVKAARDLEQDASISAALTLADSFDALADHFETTAPDATLTPESLAGTAAAKELKKEAEDTFGALPDQFSAVASAFTGRPDDFYIPTSLTGEDAEKLQDAIDAFVSDDGTATRFYLTSSSSPYSGGAFQVVKDTRVVMDGHAPGFGAAASAHVGGPIAQFTDVNDTLAKDFQKVGVVTVLGVLLVLVLLLRAIVAPLYLVATVVISYASTIGLSAFLFQEVMGSPGISPYLPLMVFVLLVALGSDYNIFLMHRIREEAETRGMRDAVRIASGHTGAVITSAGLILAGTFGSMATAPLVILFQVGIAVAIGVLIDTFLVRSILVPAITTLVGDWAWWPSKMVHHIPGEAPVPVPVPVGAGVPVPTGAGAADPVAVATGAAAVGGAGAGGDGVGGVGGVGVAAAVAATWSPTGEALVTGDAIVGNDAAQGAAERARGASRRRLAVGLALVVLLPLAVAGLLTWSLGGAFDRIGSVQAAVVNLDEGGTMTLPNGADTTLALGDDLTTTLLAPGAGEGFTWVETDAATADAGLADGTYAAVLTIPAEFSRTVAALRSDTTGSAPQASLGIVTDDSSGYALGTVARAVSAAIATATAQGVTASYVDDVLLAVTDAQARLSSASGTASQLADDSSSLAGDASGVEVFAGQLVDGLQELVDGTSDTSGIDELVDGTAALADGVTKVADGQRELAKGTKAAAAGAQKLADGATQVADGAGTLATETASLPAQVDQLATGAGQLANGSTQLAGGWSLLVFGNGTPQNPGLVGMAAGVNGLGNTAGDLDSLADQAASSAQTTFNGAVDVATIAGNVAQNAGGLAQSAGALAGSAGAAYQACVATYGAGDAVCQSLDGLVAQSGAVAADAGALANQAGNAATRAGAVAADAGMTDGLADGVTQYTGPLAAQLPQLEAGIEGAAAGAETLSTNTDTLAAGLGTYAAGVRTFADSAPQLADGISQLSTGTSGIASGASDVADGLDKLASGSAALAAGAGKAADGAQTLADGVASNMGDLDQLTEAGDLALEAGRLVEAQAANLAESGDSVSDDAQALADDLDASASGIGSYGTEQRTKLSALAADPIAVDAKRVNGAGGLQGGIAPFLMALAAWLGVMGAFLLLPAAWPTGERRWIRGVLFGFGAAAAVGLAASLLMVAGMVLLLGLPVASVPQLVFFAVLATLAFTALVQALVVLFGSRGWLGALLLLVLQAAAVGFPAAVIPGPIAALRPFLPMTYAVDGLRGAMTGAGSVPMIDAFALSAFLVVGLLVTLARVASQAARRNRTEVVAGSAGGAA